MQANALLWRKQKGKTFAQDWAARKSATGGLTVKSSAKLQTKNMNAIEALRKKWSQKNDQAFENGVDKATSQER